MILAAALPFILKYKQAKDTVADTYLSRLQRLAKLEDNFHRVLTEISYVPCVLSFVSW